MAGDEYYHNANQSSSSSDQSTPRMPLHLLFFLSTLLLFLGLSWYLSYESVVGSLFDKLKMTVMLLPVVLLLAFHVLRDNEWTSFIVPLRERNYQSLQHTGGGSPWGVAMVLVLLIVMVSYKSSFEDRWFPLISR